MPVPLLAPRFWAAHLVALVLVGSAAWLGFWQLDAWQTRRAAEAVDLARSAPVPLAEVIGPDDPFPGDQVGRPVEVTGTWRPDETFFVDRDDGVWVVTPLTVAGQEAGLLVVRGVAPDPASAPPPPDGDAELVGRLQPSEESSGADPDPDDDVLPVLRVADVIQRVDQDLYGAYAVATAPAPGLEPASLEQLPPASRFTALRNLLYGLEWWVFGGFAAFVWWRWVRDHRHQPQTRAEDEDAPDDAVLSEP